MSRFMRLARLILKFSSVEGPYEIGTFNTPDSESPTGMSPRKWYFSVDPVRGIVNTPTRGGWLYDEYQDHQTSWIMYPSGSFAYDDPYQVPKEVKFEFQSVAADYFTVDPGPVPDSAPQDLKRLVEKSETVDRLNRLFRMSRIARIVNSAYEPTDMYGPPGKYPVERVRYRTHAFPNLIVSFGFNFEDYQLEEDLESGDPELEERAQAVVNKGGPEVLDVAKELGDMLGFEISKHQLDHEGGVITTLNTVDDIKRLHQAILSNSGGGVDSIYLSDYMVAQGFYLFPEGVNGPRYSFEDWDTFFDDYRNHMQPLSLEEIGRFLYGNWEGMPKQVYDIVSRIMDNRLNRTDYGWYPVTRPEFEKLIMLVESLWGDPRASEFALDMRHYLDSNPPELSDRVRGVYEVTVGLSNPPGGISQDGVDMVVNMNKVPEWLNDDQKAFVRRWMAGDHDDTIKVMVEAKSPTEAEEMAVGVLLKKYPQLKRRWPQVLMGQTLRVDDTLEDKRDVRRNLDRLFRKSHVKRQALIAARKLAEFKHQSLYHVTYYNRLNSIASNGLKFNCEKAISTGGYAYHCENGVFLGTFEAMEHYYNRSEEFAYNYSDHVGRDGFVPVVLKVDMGYVGEDLIEPDQLSNVEAYKVALEIKPNWMQVWDGTSWVSLWKGVYNIDPMEGVDLEGEEDEEEYSSFKLDQPLKPRVP